ncbi:hypothetical protein Goshw_000564, partial [Gossypium schwendimanii]|nr:hypothetical protein [Gossypium schwendimanii]
MVSVVLGLNRGFVFCLYREPTCCEQFDSQRENTLKNWAIPGRQWARHSCPLGEWPCVHVWLNSSRCSPYISQTAHGTLTLGNNDDVQDWLNHGGNLLNRRFTDKETMISPKIVSRLRLKWKFNAGQDIFATPAIFDGTVYFPSRDRYIYAVKASNGGLVWKKKLQQLTGLNSTRAVSNIHPNITVLRTTPVIAHDLLIFGMSGLAYVVAVKRSNGELVWLTQLDKHPKAIIT